MRLGCDNRFVVVDQDVVLGTFSDQAYNLILLAEDEARMLGQVRVEPEHVLLALARSGNVERLLARREVTATDIYRMIVSSGGLGEELWLGRVPRSGATDAALEAGIDAAAERGVAGPSSEHVLLGLRGDSGATAILRALGIDDLEALVDEAYPERGVPVASEARASYRTRVGRSRGRPQPGPTPPVFERFTAQARDAIIAAQRGDSGYAQPVDLLRGLVTTEDGVAPRVLMQHGLTPAAFESDRRQSSGPRSGRGRWGVGSSTPIASSSRNSAGHAKDHLRGRRPQVGQLYSDDTRRLIAEESLRQAVSHGHRLIGTGHLLLAVIDDNNQEVAAILGDAESIRTEVITALPGDET